MQRIIIHLKLHKKLKPLEVLSFQAFFFLILDQTET